jgi:hypothetical protein
LAYPELRPRLSLSDNFLKNWYLTIQRKTQSGYFEPKLPHAAQRATRSEMPKAATEIHVKANCHHPGQPRRQSDPFQKYRASGLYFGVCIPACGPRRLSD